MITPLIKKKIQEVVSVFETSSRKPLYDILVVLPDGPNRCRQITYGKHQTTEFGNLKALIKSYIASYGRYAKDFQPFLGMIGTRMLCDNQQFKALLKLAGTDQQMHEVQDKFFDEVYWKPAERFFLQQGFTLNLSMLVIYDSYIHSGGIPAWLRDDFAQVPPAQGGDEKAWTRAYVTCRDYWLEHHENKILRNTDYRTDCMLEEIEQGNWDLSGELVCKFNQADKKNWITIP